MEYNLNMLIRSILVILLLVTSYLPVHQTPDPFVVQFHPEGKLFVGDLVSMEVIPINEMNLEGKQVNIGFEGIDLAVTDFSNFGIDQREQATLWWVLDTSELKVGNHTLSFSMVPEGPTWDETIRLYPQKENPYLEAEWEIVNTDCCFLHYISGTDAARDIENLSLMVDKQADDVLDKLNTRLDKPINITFIPKLIGQGGFASDGIYVSYFDGNITGDVTAQVIHHEMVHILDDALGRGGKPTLLVEGLAVYLSNGHYKQENLLTRAASLLPLDAYIPLEDLLKDFYHQQHEISYLEAGALIEFMVNQYGWDAFTKFFSIIDINGDPGMGLEMAIIHEFDMDQDQLEQAFINFLKTQESDESSKNDLEMTIDFYDAIRLFQQKLDPSTYFATAWLPDGSTMQERGIVADFIRSRSEWDVYLMEYLLRTSSHLISDQEYQQADWIIGLVNLILNLYPIN